MLKMHKKGDFMKFYKNLIPEFMNDDLFFKLSELGFLDYKRIRDYAIRREFKELRKTKGANESIMIIHNNYPELQIDTIRKIIYIK